MLKKIAVVFCALLLILTVTLPVSADESTFTEDFSAGNFDKWSNPTLDAVAGVEDSETKGVVKIENGVMEIENASTMGNFFYIGVKNVKTLNFTMSMKVRVDLFNDGWIGISFRKDFNERYNACNNNMVTLRAQTDHKLALQGYRGYAGSAVLLTNDVKGGFVVEEGTEWVTWTLEVNGSNWKSYINDALFGEWTYDKNQNEGFISINACLFDGAVDDIEIAGDIATITPPATEPPIEQPTEDPEEIPTQAPTQAPATMPPADEPDTSYIKSTYKDVTIDYLFGAITLDNPLSVSDFKLSFKLSDYYKLTLVDAAGNEVTDDATTVTEDMKAVVYRGSEKVKEYTLVVNETEQVKPPVNTGSQNNNSQGLPMGAIVAIIVAVILAAGAVAVALIFKKKSTK